MPSAGRSPCVISPGTTPGMTSTTSVNSNRSGGGLGTGRVTPPNKGMKLTKLGELRSFAAYPGVIRTSEVFGGRRMLVARLVVAASLIAALAEPGKGLLALRI